MLTSLPISATKTEHLRLGIACAFDSFPLSSHIKHIYFRSVTYIFIIPLRTLPLDTYVCKKLGLSYKIKIFVVFRSRLTVNQKLMYNNEYLGGLFLQWCCHWSVKLRKINRMFIKKRGSCSHVASSLEIL